MTESILLHFIDRINSNYTDYCAICLRTSEERRLEKPKHLNKFLQSIYRPTFDLSCQQVCFVCERQAAAAFQFVMATNLAVTARDVIQWLKESKSIIRVKKTFQTYNFKKHLMLDEQNQSGFSALHKALDCEAKLRAQQMRSQLCATEILVISTPTSQAIIPEEPNAIKISATPFLRNEMDQSRPPRPGELRDTYVVPDDAPAQVAMEKVDTYDLTEEPEVTIPLITSDQNDPIATGDINKQNKEIAKRKRSQNNTRVVPIEKLMDTNNSIPNTQWQDVTPPQNFILHPVVFNSGMLTVPTLSANIINGQLIIRSTENNDNVIKETPKIAMKYEQSIDFVSDPVQVMNIFNKLSHQDVDKVHILTAADMDNLNSYPMVDLGNLNSCPNGQTDSLNASTVNQSYSFQVNSPTVFTTRPELNNLTQFTNSDVLKRHEKIVNLSVCKDAAGQGRESAQAPTLRSDRIDWEDKIPMDLISFVDANEKSSKRVRRDLNPEPVLGVICNVKSLSETPDVIIDLC